jgi:hypothetical protein
MVGLFEKSHKNQRIEVDFLFDGYLMAKLEACRKEQ